MYSGWKDFQTPWTMTTFCKGELSVEYWYWYWYSEWPMWTMPTFCKGGLSVEYWYWYWYSEWPMWTMPTLWKGGTVSWKTVVVKRSKRDCTFPFPAPAPLKLFVRQLFWCSWDLWTEQCCLNFLSLFRYFDSVVNWKYYFDSIVN